MWSWERWNTAHGVHQMLCCYWPVETSSAALWSEHWPDTPGSRWKRKLRANNQNRFLWLFPSESLPSVTHTITRWGFLFYTAFCFCGSRFSHYNSSWCFHSMQQNRHQGENQHQRTIQLSCHLLQDNTHGQDHSQNRKKTNPRWKKQVLEQGLSIPEGSWSCGPESWTRLTWEKTASFSIKGFGRCDAPNWKREFSHPTCCGPEQAPHQNMVSGCQCWHTS